jgi:hypothetical protein
VSAYCQPAPLDLCALNRSLIQAAGSPEIYLLVDGTKHHIQTRNWLIKNGSSEAPVRVLTPAEAAAIPTGYELSDESLIPGTPAALEGKVVSGPDGSIWVVRRGERHHVMDVRWFENSRYVGQAPVPATQAELEALQLGSEYLYIPFASKERIIFLTAVLFTFFFLAASKRLEFGEFFPKWTKWLPRVVLALLFAWAIGVREPFLLSQPRFWAEEGVIWFQYAASHSAMQTLLFVYPLSSYFNLTANIGGLLAAITAARFGLAYAPAATTIFAFLIQILAIVLILFGKSRLFDSLWKALAGCLIVVFASTAPDEIWLNTINSMSFLGLICLVLLFEETGNWPGWRRWGTRGILVLCGLSSPYSAVLLPLFLLSAWHYKEREQKIQCLILMLCILVQAGVVVKTRREMVRGGTETMRGTDVRLDASLVNVFSGHMAHASIGYATREVLLDKMGLKEAWISASSFPPRPMMRSLRSGGWLCFILIAAILWSLRGRSLWCACNMMMAAFLLLAGFTCVASLHSVPTSRYAFLPGLTFLLLLLINIESPNPPAVRYACMLVLSYGLAVGITFYQDRVYEYGPSWSKEVELWSKDHAHPLQVWPFGFAAGFTYSEPQSR